MSGSEEDSRTTPASNPPVSPEETTTTGDQQSVPDAVNQISGTEDQDLGDVYNLPPSQNGAFHMDREVCVDPAVVQQLSEGFLQRFLPTLEKSKSSVDEILNSQSVVIETLEQENAKFKDCTAHLDLLATMAKAKNYHTKLLTIKRDMAFLYDKAAKLKRRALKLQQQKQREELQRAHQEERQLEKEQMLTARVASHET